MFEKAVEKAIDECINEGILVEFLKKNRAEAIEMSIFEYDEEKHMKFIREEGREEGLNLMLALISAMSTGGDTDKIPLLKDNRKLLNEMLKKYNL